MSFLVTEAPFAAKDNPSFFVDYQDFVRVVCWVALFHEHCVKSFDIYRVRVLFLGSILAKSLGSCRNQVTFGDVGLLDGCYNFGISVVSVVHSGHLMQSVRRMVRMMMLQPKNVAT